MAKTFVKNALKRGKILLAEINKNTTTTAIGNLKQTDAVLAAYFEKRLKAELLEIEVAAGLDRDNNFPVDGNDLKKLREFQLMFVTALRKLGINMKIRDLV